MPRDVSLSDSKCWNGGHEWDINDLPDVTLHALIFADDTSFTFLHDNLESLIVHVNVELIEFIKWCIGNKFTIQLYKTVLLMFSNRKNEDYANHEQINRRELNFSN